MSSYEKGLEIVARLEASGINATCDPRSAQPPCVLISPPGFTVDHGCGATGNWFATAISPTTANLDAWQVLDELVAEVINVLPIESGDFLPYSLSSDSPPLPSYRCRFTESFDL